MTAEDIIQTAHVELLLTDIEVLLCLALYLFHRRADIHLRDIDRPSAANFAIGLETYILGESISRASRIIFPSPDQSLIMTIVGTFFVTLGLLCILRITLREFWTLPSFWGVVIFLNTVAATAISSYLI